MELVVNLLVKFCVALVVYAAGYYFTESHDTDEFSIGALTGITMVGFVTFMDYILQ